MATETDFSLDRLATYREGNRLEVKSAKGGLPASLWESYSAFANSDGGVIALGVCENKDGSFSIDGVPDAHKLLKDFWNMANNRQKISCNILTDKMVSIEDVDGKEVIVIRVPRAERTSKPVYVGLDPKLGSYRRNGEGDYRCSLEEVSLMMRDASLVPEDSKILDGMSYSVFCPDTIRSYRQIFRLTHPNHTWNDDEDEIFMRRLGAVRENKDTGKFHPTAAGLLMFGYEYEITGEFPNYFLDYQENRTNGVYARWTDRITSQTGDWSGNVFDFILKVVPRLQSDLKTPFVFKGNLRDEDTPVHKAVREAAVNMVTNADFYGRRGVVVQKSAEGFKFANPGSMRVSVREAVEDNISDPRNGTMLKMLALVGYGERAGSGLQGIFRTWTKVYHTEPEVDVATGGVDRTTFSLNFGGIQPDIEAMRQLYDEPDQIEFREKGTDKSTEKMQNALESSEEKMNIAPESSLKAQNALEIIADALKSGDIAPENKFTTLKDALKNKDVALETLISSPIFAESSPEEKVLLLVIVDTHLNQERIAELIGKSRRTVQHITERLQKDGHLTRIGSTKAGEWLVLK